MVVQGPPNDSVNLNGIDYLIKGPVRGETLSDYESGFKIGKASYDTREDAFFISIDDLSGGFGHRRVHDQNATDTFWESSPSNAPDMSRKSHITLGWPKVETALTAPDHSDMTKRNPSNPSCLMPDGSYVFGFGNKLYKWSSGVTYTVVGTGGADAAEVQSIVEFVESTGTISHWAFFSSLTGATTGTARYMKSLDGGATWANGAQNYVLHDAIFWDNKIIAAYNKSIIFGTVTAGVETWNIDVATDGQKITSVSHGNIHFLGIAEAPFGQPAVYFTDEDQMWVLDFYARACYRIDVGLAGHFITASCQWGGNFLLSDGWNIQEYDVPSRSLKNIGFPRYDGVTTTMRTGYITALFPSEGSLMAVVTNTTGPTTTLWQDKGNGWAQIGQSSAIYCHMGFQSNIRTNWLDTTRTIHLIGAPTSTSTAGVAEKYTLPAAGHIPVVGVDNFAPSGAYFITSWYDGGFPELIGAGLRMYCDGNIDAILSVNVECQIDNESAPWQNLVNELGVVSPFITTTSTQYFPGADYQSGLQFKLIRFRVTLNRGADATQSPELRSLIFVYYKKPIIRTGWSFVIDTTRMINKGMAASVFAIYTNLATAWASQPMVGFTINGLHTGRVMLKHIKVTMDNTRTNKTDPLDGTIEVTVIEPV